MADTITARVTLRASQALGLELQLTSEPSGQAFQTGSPFSYLVQEEDGTSRIELEEGGGFLILEDDAAYQADAFQSGGVDIFRSLTLIRPGRT